MLVDDCVSRGWEVGDLGKVGFSERTQLWPSAILSVARAADNAMSRCSLPLQLVYRKLLKDGLLLVSQRDY
jgi:hypothetical protein